MLCRISDSGRGRDCLVFSDYWNGLTSVQVVSAKTRGFHTPDELPRDALPQIRSDPGATGKRPGNCCTAVERTSWVGARRGLGAAGVPWLSLRPCADCYQTRGVGCVCGVVTTTRTRRYFLNGGRDKEWPAMNVTVCQLCNGTDQSRIPLRCQRVYSVFVPVVPIRIIVPHTPGLKPSPLNTEKRRHVPWRWLQCGDALAKAMAPTDLGSSRQRLAVLARFRRAAEIISPDFLEQVHVHSARHRSLGTTLQSSHWLPAAATANWYISPAFSFVLNGISYPMPDGVVNSSPQRTVHEYHDIRWNGRIPSSAAVTTTSNPTFHHRARNSFGGSAIPVGQAIVRRPGSDDSIPRDDDGRTSFSCSELLPTIRTGRRIESCDIRRITATACTPTRRTHQVQITDPGSARWGGSISQKKPPPPPPPTRFVERDRPRSLSES